MGRVEHIHVAERAGAPMRPLRVTEARAGEGLAVDRYGAREGYWRSARVSRDLTL